MFNQVPPEVFAILFRGAAEAAETFKYFQAHTYLGSDSSDRIALANKIAGGPPSTLSMWARVNFSVQATNLGRHDDVLSARGRQRFRRPLHNRAFRFR